MNGFSRELATVARFWRREPRVSLLVVLALGLGIGANTAVFSLVRHVLFRSFPVESPERLVRVFNAETRGGEDFWSTSEPIYRDYRAQSTSFSGLAAYRDGVPVHLSLGGGGAERLEGAVVSSNFFAVAGGRPALGRFFAEDDEVGGEARPVAVVSHAFWSRALGAAPAAVGRAVRINGQELTVIGVAPRGFGGVDLGRRTDVWLLLPWIAKADPVLATEWRSRATTTFQMIGRLAPGVSPLRAQAELETLAARLGAGREVISEEELPEPWPQVVPLLEMVRPQAVRISWMLLGTVFLVLLIACADVAGFFLARAEREQRQVAIRLALGASRARVLRQLLVEGVAFAACGALVGLLFAGWIGRLLARFAPAQMPVPLPSDLRVLDLRVLAFTAGISLLSGALIGLLPGLRALRTSPALVLKGDAPAVPLGRRRLPARSLLVIAQVAVSVVLLFGASLLLRTVWNMASLDSGLREERVLTASVDLGRQGYDKEAGEAFLQRLLERARALPGVRSAALITVSPLPGPRGAALLPPGAPEGEDVWVGLGLITPDYFETLGIPLLRGRDLSARDGRGAPLVGIVNRAFAERFWPGRDPIGQRLEGVGPEKASVEIVGLAGNTRNRGPREEPGPILYLPLARMYQAYRWQPGSTTVLLAAEREPAALAPALVRTAAELDPDLPLFGVRPLREQLGTSLGLERFLAVLFAVQGLLALGLVGIGLHALLAFTTALRSREIAVRTAIGASRAEISRLVYRQSFSLVLAGLAAGALLAWLALRPLSTLLFGVAAADVPSLALTAGLLAAIAWLAPRRPLRRALAINPAEILRSE